MTIKFFQTSRFIDTRKRCESQKNDSDIGIEVYNWCRAGCKRHCRSEELYEHPYGSGTDKADLTSATDKVISYKQMRLSNENGIGGNGVMDVNDNFVLVVSSSSNESQQ